MNLNRREFLKGIGITSVALALGRPVCESLLKHKQEYQLVLVLDEKKIGEFIHVEVLDDYPRKELVALWSMRRGWINACVSITDQYNRPWEIIGYFESLKSPEGWIFSLDRNGS